MGLVGGLGSVGAGEAPRHWQSEKKVVWVLRGQWREFGFSGRSGLSSRPRFHRWLGSWFLGRRWSRAAWLFRSIQNSFVLGMSLGRHRFRWGEGLVGTRAAVESCSFGGFFGGIGLGAFFVFGATVPSLSVIVSIGSNGFSTSLSSRRLGALVDLVFGLRGTEGLCPRLAAVAGEGTGEGAGEMEGEGVLGGVSY